ncbi:MAG: hypothetical protein HY293_13940 [Planctomycetes bacterium]|nr:hypothetical protein [Planctomycetota bacterium]
MNFSASTFVERRDETRVPGRSPARMEAPKAIFGQAGPIVIEEVSATGLRLRSEVQLHPNEELVVHVKGEALPLHTSVVWVREAPPLHLGGHKTWIAGCHLHPDSMAKLRLLPEVKTLRMAGFGRLAFWIFGILAAAAILTFLYLRFASFLGIAGGSN